MSVYNIEENREKRKKKDGKSFRRTYAIYLYSGNVFIIFKQAGGIAGGRMQVLIRVILRHG